MVEQDHSCSIKSNLVLDIRLLPHDDVAGVKHLDYYHMMLGIKLTAIWRHHTAIIVELIGTQ